MTWQSSKYNNKWSELEDFYQSELNPKSMSKYLTPHNLSMFGGLAVIFITAVTPFFHGGMSPAEIFTAIVTGLVAVVHAVGGNTSTSTN